jgi:heptosyltransferase-2
MSISKILIRTPNWLGDLMMSTAFIKEVLLRFPAAQVDLVVKKGFEGIPLPHRGNVLPFDKQSVSAYRFGKELRKASYQRFYILPPSFSAAVMAFAANVPERIGYSGNLRRLLLNRPKHYLQKHRSRHLITEYLQLLDDRQSTSEAFPGLNIDQNWVEQTLATMFATLPASFVCIAPGVIYGSAKQWPVAYFKTLVAKLEASGERVVLIGTGHDNSLGEQLSHGLQRVLNLCGRTDLNQLIAVLAKAKALVSNDSGTMHVMAALQKPQVAIFGSTSSVWTGPVNQKAKIVHLNLECSPCYQRKCPLGHTNCLNQILPDKVWECLKPML